MEEPSLTIQIETGSTCNAGCHFCVYPQVAKVRVGKLMPSELLRKIVDEAVTIPVISDWVLMGLNEPLLDRRLEEFVSYIKASAPRFKTCIYTNGLLLTPQRHDSLRSAGLDTVVVSLNAVRPEQHDSVMGMRGKFDTICANIDYAISRGGTVDVHAVFDAVTFPMSDVEEFLGRWGDKRFGGHGLVARMGDWAGDVSVPVEARDIACSNNLCCFRAMSFMYVMYDGRVSACCFDPLGRLVFGDLNTQTIREIYNSPEYVAFREAHSKNEANKFDLCANCSRI